MDHGKGDLETIMYTSYMVNEVRGPRLHYSQNSEVPDTITYIGEPWRVGGEA